MATTCFLTLTASDYVPAGGAFANASRRGVLTINGTRGALSTALTQNTLALVSPQVQSADATVAASGPNTIPGGAAGVVGAVFITPALAAVTIAGGFTANVRAAEGNAMANYGPGFGVWRLSGTTAAVISTISSGVELGTTEAALSLPDTALSNNVLANGDRLAIVFFFAPAGGTAASGFTATSWVGGPTSGASGDAFVTFAETLTVQAEAATPPRPTVVLQAVQRASSW